MYTKATCDMPGNNTDADNLTRYYYHYYYGYKRYFDCKCLVSTFESTIGA